MYQKLAIPYNLGLTFALLLVNYEIVIYLSSDAYLPSLPQIAHEFSASQQIIQLTITAWCLGSASFQLILGPLSERVGRRPILLVGGFIFITSTFFCTICTNIHLFLVMRFLQGAALSTVTVVGYSTIHDLFDRTQAINVLALMSGLMILAPAFGPLLGAVILYYANWRSIFLLLGLWATFAMIGLYFYMPETVTDKYKTINFRKIMKQYKNILINKKYILLLFTSRCFYGAMIAWVYASPFLLIEKFGFSNFEYATVQVLIFCSYNISTRILKLLLNKLALRVIVFAGILSFIISSVASITLAYIFPENPWCMISCMILLTAGSGISFPIISRITIESSNENMGSKVAMTSFLTFSFGMIVSGIISFLYDNSLLSLGLILILFSALGGLIFSKSRLYIT